MFGFFKKKQPQTASGKPVRLYPLSSDLTDAALVDFICRVFSESKPVVGALFLVALENLSVYYAVFHKSVQDSKEYPASMDGMTAFILDAHAEHQGTSLDNEINSRRWFYLYVAALLTVAQTRARAKPELWEAIAEVWILLMPGARALRATLDGTSLWKPNEVDFFDEVKTEDDGEKFVESVLLPSEIRYHKKLLEWRERDLPQDIRDELARMDKFIRGEE